MAQERLEAHLAEREASEDKPSTVTRTLLDGMRLVGRTAGLASWMANRAASGIVTTGHKVLSLPAGICSFNPQAKEQRRAEKQVDRAEAEIAQQEETIDGLCTKIGRRLCEIGKEDASAVPDDAQLGALVSTVRDAEGKIRELNAEIVRLVEQLAKPEQEVPAPEAKKQEESAAPPESAPEATDRAEAAPKAEPELAAKAAAIIREHPDGVSLAEMGKSLGVSWQTLIGVARELVETKQAKKADSKYYPR